MATVRDDLGTVRHSANHLLLRMRTENTPLHVRTNIDLALSALDRAIRLMDHREEQSKKETRIR